MSRRSGAVTGFLVVAALICGVTLATGQEAVPSPVTGALGYAVASVPASQVQASREALISDVLRMWPSPPGQSAEQLGTALRRASSEQLASALGANSYGEVNSILLGSQPNALGSTSGDYVYTAVAPCRIFDTRNPGGGGALPPSGMRDFYVYGTVEFRTLSGDLTSMTVASA